MYLCLYVLQIANTKHCMIFLLCGMYTHVHSYVDSGDTPISVKESVTKTSPTIETVFGSRDQSSLSSLPEFHHQTGEENEKVVLQVHTQREREMVISVHFLSTVFSLQFQAKLFTFEKETQSWKEKGRGLISLNDICQSTSEGIFQSRLGEALANLTV